MKNWAIYLFDIQVILHKMCFNGGFFYLQCLLFPRSLLPTSFFLLRAWKTLKKWCIGPRHFALRRQISSRRTQNSTRFLFTPYVTTFYFFLAIYVRFFSLADSAYLIISFIICWNYICPNNAHTNDRRCRQCIFAKATVRTRKLL